LKRNNVQDCEKQVRMANTNAKMFVYTAIFYSKNGFYGRKLRAFNLDGHGYSS